MLANDLTLDNADGSDVVYRLVNNSADGTRRLDVASSVALPSVLSIKHSVTGKAPNLVDRHLVQLTKTKAAAVGTVAASVNFTLTIPRDTAISTTDIHNLVANVVDFLSDGGITGLATQANVDAVVRGES